MINRAGNAKFRAGDGNLSRSAQMGILERRQANTFRGLMVRAGDRRSDTARLIALRGVQPEPGGRFTSLATEFDRSNPDGLVRQPGGHLFSERLGIEIKPFYSAGEMDALRSRFPNMTIDQILRELTKLGNQSWRV